MKRKYLFLLILPLLVCSFILTSPLGVKATVVPLKGQNCSSEFPWDYVPLQGNQSSYLYQANPGYVVTEYCFKVENDLYGEVLSVPTSQVDVVSHIYAGSSEKLKNITHTSFKLEQIPFVRITYICELPEDGTVEGYGVTGFAGEHLWRVRHEKGGPSTNFTLMAGGNIFAWISDYINTDETLLYLTTEEFNGVSVKTFPLPNDYKGTASVSGALCSIMGEYEQCSETAMVEGAWSDWKVDPSDSTREYSERTISYYDSMDGEYLCDTEVETKYQVIPEEPEIQDEEEEDNGDDEDNGDEGEEDTTQEDTPEVAGVSDQAIAEVEEVGVVLAETGATSNILVYVIQAILTLSTIFSGIFFSKKYIM
jgi:hypothetical protein